MKRILIIAIGLLFIIYPSYAQESVQSQIKQVTLLSDQALVKREAAAKVSKGTAEILLDSGAFNVDEDSLQAKVFGDGEVYSVQMRDVYMKEAPQENIKALEQKLKEAREARRVLSDRIEVFNKKERFLNSFIDFANVEIPKEVKTNFPAAENFQKTLVFLDEGYSAIGKEKQAVDSKIVELDKDIMVLEQELQTLRNNRTRSKKAIEVLFNSAKDQEIRIEASYLVYNAYWQPLYKVDVPLDLKSVNLMMFAKIKQITGEDWKNIKLAISNVIPLRGAETPSLSSWILDTQRTLRSQDQAFDASMGAMCKEDSTGRGIAMSQAVQQEAKFVMAQKKELPLSFEYELPQALSIESKDKETILPLFSKTMEGKFFDYAVPKMSQMTFLLCSASSDKELLSAPLNVYFGGRFVGKTFLSEKKPGEDFELNLGADREVKVKRQKVTDKITETMLFGKIERLTLIRELIFKITAENLKDKPVKLRIADNIPVSKTDKIEVKDVKMAPDPTRKNYQDKEGVMLWETELKSKEKREILISFTITYPKDTPVELLQI